MCIAIVKPAASKLSEELLRTCFTNNPDGAGFAIRAEGGMQVHKGFFKIEDFLAAYAAHNVNDLDALVHFRITTRGSEDAENCHPFAIGNGALVHNGTINGLGKVGEGKSDTQIFAEMIYREDIATLTRLKPIIEDYLTYNRVAVMDNDGNTIVFNEKDWITVDGVMYSNDGYLADSSYLGLRKTWTTPKSYAGLGASRGLLYDDDEDMHGFDGYLSAAEEYAEELMDAEDIYRDQYVYMGQPVRDYRPMPDTLLNGFMWDGLELWVMQDDGDYAVDHKLQQTVLDIWFDLFAEDAAWPKDKDQYILDNITDDILDILFTVPQEPKTCPSTPAASAPKTVTPSASSPTTSPATGPTPSSSKTPASSSDSTVSSAAQPMTAIA